MPLTSPFLLVALAAAALLPALLPLAWRGRWLLLVSLAAYAWASPVGAACIALAALAVHRIALRLARADPERPASGLFWLGAGLTFLPLAAWKAHEALAAAPAGVLVPLGLSFATFKLLAYLVEVYWGRLEPEPRAGPVLLLATFLPQLTAGPIQRPADFLAQLRAGLAPTPELAAAGLRLVLFGLFQKLVVADRIGILVDGVWAELAGASRGQVLLAAGLYPLQLYADFSALTDLANGLALLSGIRAPQNFFLPFWSRSPAEFWRCWHASLTSWLADYAFTPLSLALRPLGAAGRTLALFLNMLAVGAWHGLQPTFLAFGAFHGLLLAVTAWRPARPRGAAAAALGALATFLAVAAGFVLFRAPDLGAAAALLRRALGSEGPAGPGPEPTSARRQALALAAFGVMELLHLARVRGWRLPAARPLRWAGYYALVAAILALGVFSQGRFIYAQF